MAYGRCCHRSRKEQPEWGNYRGSPAAIAGQNGGPLPWRTIRELNGRHAASRRPGLSRNKPPATGCGYRNPTTGPSKSYQPEKTASTLS
jgi:hypothetical protein